MEHTLVSGPSFVVPLLEALLLLLVGAVANPIDLLSHVILHIFPTSFNL